VHHRKQQEFFMETNVGSLRHQAAFANSRTPVIIIVADENLQQLLNGRNLEIVNFYPDTTDAEGKFNNSFKVEVKLAK
jgi:hypothetical protein